MSEVHYGCYVMHHSVHQASVPVSRTYLTFMRSDMSKICICRVSAIKNEKNANISRKCSLEVSTVAYWCITNNPVL